MGTLIKHPIREIRNQWQRKRISVFLNLLKVETDRPMRIQCHFRRANWLLRDKAASLVMRVGVEICGIVSQHLLLFHGSLYE